MRISKRCFAVTGLGYSAPWSVNAGFIVGEHTTLVVDTGANAAGATTIHGYAVTARPGNALRVINTEKHFDHVGGNLYFSKLGAEIWGHEGIARTGAEFSAEIEAFNATIPNRARRARKEARIFYHETAPANPTQTISADDHMDLGDCRVEILLTPGHTATNLSVWTPSERVLYCGDCLVNLYLPNLDASRPPDWKMWLDSIARIQALNPSAIVCGHGPVAMGDAVSAVIEHVSAELHKAIRSGVSPTAS